MSYRLDSDQHLAKNLRRISRQQVGSALEASRIATDGQRSPVHETRKHLKKARAALALLRPVIGKSEFKETSARLRTVSHLLSGLRDAEARCATVRELRQKAPPRISSSFENAEILLDFELESFRAAFADWPEQAGRQLHRLHRRIRKCDLDALSKKRLKSCLQENYRRARQALRAALVKPNPESLHLFRKRAKALMYQLRILRPLDPGLLDPQLNDLRILTEKLGRAHDLAFVEERLSTLEPRAKGNRRKQVEALIDCRTAELEESAVLLGQRIFSETPKAFARRLSLEPPRATQLELYLPSERAC